MDIGATVCVPNGAPHCVECPLHAFCKACAKGTQTRYPVKKAQKERRVEDKTVLLMLDADRIALHKRPSKGLLAGCMEFQCLTGKHTDQEVLQYLKAQGLPNDPDSVAGRGEACLFPYRVAHDRILGTCR